MNDVDKSLLFMCVGSVLWHQGDWYGWVVMTWGLIYVIKDIAAWFKSPDRKWNR